MNTANWPLLGRMCLAIANLFCECKITKSTRIMFLSVSFFLITTVHLYLLQSYSSIQFIVVVFVILSLSPSLMPSYFFSGNLFLFPSQSLTWRSIWDIETPLPGRSQQQCFKMPSSRHAIPQIWDIGTLPPCRCLSDLKHWNTPTLQVPSGRCAALHAKHVTTINTTNKCMMPMVVLMY